MFSYSFFTASLTTGKTESKGLTWLYLIESPNPVLYLVFGNVSPIGFTQIQTQNKFFYRYASTRLRCVSCIRICGPALLNAFQSLSKHLKRILKPELAWVLYNNIQDPGLFPRILFWFPSKFGHAWEFAEDGTWTSDFLNVTLGSMAFVCLRVLRLDF